MSHAERVSRWRRIAIQNTVVAALLVVVVWLAAPAVIAVPVTVIMVVGSGDLWFLLNRVRISGNPFSRAAPSSELDGRN